MGRTEPGTYTTSWTPPTYVVDDDGKVVGLPEPPRPHNWGRWGALDQRGAANFITPRLVAAAASTITEGRVVSCAVPLDRTGPLHPSRAQISHWYTLPGTEYVTGNAINLVYPGVQITDDAISMPLQGSTQWDALAHYASDDALYNGFWIGTVEQTAGATRNSIHQLKNTLCGRGVLLDVARHQGVERVAQGYAITSEDLEACARAQGVQVGTGDILVVRTGHVPWFYSLADKTPFFTGGAPGLSIDTVDWLHAHEVAAVAVDNIAVEVEPFEAPVDVPYPLHKRLLRDLGITMGEVWHLEELSEVCDALGRYFFYLSAPPLNVTNASGSPINPVAVF